MMKQIPLILAIILVSCSHAQTQGLFEMVISHPEQFVGKTVQLNGAIGKHVTHCSESGLCSYEYYLVKDSHTAKAIDSFEANISGLKVAKQGVAVTCTDQWQNEEQMQVKQCNHNKLLGVIYEKEQELTGRLMEQNGRYYFELFS